MRGHHDAERIQLMQGVLTLGLVGTALAGCAQASEASAQAGDSTPPFAMHAPGTMVTLDTDALMWRPLQPDGFPPGMQVAVIQGDRTKREPFTARLRFPAGFRFPAHRHASVEHLTVISGALLFGAGGQFDERLLRAHQPGDVLIAPAGMAHFGGATGETVVQFHGIGPFGITVVDPYLPAPAS
jgi:quercetin dioxygenase-like cupin family protein